MSGRLRGGRVPPPGHPQCVSVGGPWGAQGQAALPYGATRQALRVPVTLAAALAVLCVPSRSPTPCTAGGAHHCSGASIPGPRLAPCPGAQAPFVALLPLPSEWGMWCRPRLCPTWNSVLSPATHRLLSQPGRPSWQGQLLGLCSLIGLSPLGRGTPVCPDPAHLLTRRSRKAFL